MADTQSNIQVSIDTTQALASIKNLQRQISAFHSSMAKGGAAANAVSAQLQQTLINSVNATGQFSAGIRTIRTTTESFTSSLERNKFSLGEYFRYAGGATKTFGRLFKTEHDTINKVARENVKDLQTQYIRLGRDASGAMKAIAVRPLALDMTDLGTRTQIAAQKQAILNQLLKQGSTNLLNFGKNTQWAGRQLMVGFTLPLMALGSVASKTFMDMETQAIRFKKVYGDLFTPTGESQQALKDIQELGKEFTKYGIAVSSTVGLAAEAAAAGFKGVDLTRQTTAATRLSILGQVESQKALETTIALQNAFSMSSENLAESIDFLNAVENQTVLSLDDISTAIPKAAPIVQQLGGDVKDLAFLMTAMKEGGINASEGANALKSGLASLINPTGKANDMLLSFGINAKKIVVDNKGDLKKTVVEFATALNQLDPLNRAQAIEQMFGKFQFSRLSTLFANVTKEGTQASRVLDLAGASVQELATLSEKELGMTSESAMNKFKGAVENLKVSLIPLGEQFLKAVTPIAEFITKILSKFEGLSENTKKIIVVITGLVAGLGPVLLMTVGLVMNGLANMVKLFAFLKSAFNRTGQSTAILGTEVQYMTTEQRNAAAVAASLDQVHTKLSQTFTSEASAVNALTRAYQRAVAAQSQFVPVAPPITRGPIRKFAAGKPATVGGTGNKDSELALLMPGETVIPTAMSKKYAPLINAMIAGNIPGYEFGKTRTVASHIEGFTPGQLVTTLSDPIMKKVLSILPDVGVSVQALSTTADGLVTVSGAIETSLQNLATTLSENNIETATAIATGEFAGTTTPTSSERNLMLNSAGIAGEPITFEQAQEASRKAQTYIAKPVTNETDNTRAQKEEARRLVQEQLDFERSLVGLSQQEVEARKTDFTRTKATQALEYTLMQKGLSAEEAATLAKQKIAEAEKAVAQLTEKAKTDLEKRKIKEAAYQATLLKEMGVVAGYDEKKTKTTVFNRTQLNAVPRDMAKGQVQFGTPYAPGEQVPSDAAVFGSGKSFRGVKGGRVSRNQSAIVDASIRETYSADRKRVRDSFKKQGADSARAFKDGFKSVKTPDPYVASRDRKSPHRLAPEDGKDDARAYSTARDKELRRQSGRARRAATRPQGPAVVPVVEKTPRKPGAVTRPQGPAPIGATPQPGMTILPIVPRGSSTVIDPDSPNPNTFNPNDPNTRPKTRLAGMAGKMTGMGGGMGILGVNMGLSMLPDFAGKGILQGGLAGANLGQMFGPYGMAIGATIGTVTSAVSALIGKYKELADVTKATFTSSADVATFFGNRVVETTLKVGAFSTSIVGLSGSTDKLGQSFGYTNEELARFTTLIESLPEDNAMREVVDEMKEESDPSKILDLARKFLTTQIAIGQMSVEQGQVLLDLMLSYSGNLSMVGTAFLNISSQTQAVSMHLKSAATNSTLLGDALLQLLGAASNTSSLETVRKIIEGIGLAGLNSKKALDALAAAMIRVKAPDDYINALKVFRSIDGIQEDQVIELMDAVTRGVSIDTTGKTLKEILEKARKDLDELEKTQTGSSSNTQTKAYQEIEKQTSASKKQIAILKKKKKVIDDEIKKQEKITSELKRQNDYLDKQRSLDKSIIEAKIKGDYIGAASLLQEKTQNTAEFNQESEKAKLQAKSDALQDQIDALQLKNDELVNAINQSATDQVAATETSTEKIVAAITLGKVKGPIDKEFQDPISKREDSSGVAGVTKGGDKPGSTKKYYDSAGNEITKELYEDLPVGAPIGKDGAGTEFKVPITELSGRDFANRFTATRAFFAANNDKGSFKTADGFTYYANGSVRGPDKKIVGAWYANKPGSVQVRSYRDGSIGGVVRGAGTPTSDSIPAYLSNGEYVVKAKSVKKYGVGTLDALNAGRFAEGGQVGRSASSYIPRLKDGGNVKDGFMQRWSKSISGSPLAEMMGTAQLLRLISGQGKKGDKLGASMVPLSLLGSGFGSKIMGNLGKSAFYLPNKINQMINQRKVNSMLKSGVFHGSQPVGFRGEEYLQGTNILDGSQSYDPHYGMGFFGTTSKAEARLYASGYNSTNNWGESFGSMNQIVGAPRGKYVDFTRGPKSLKWQDYGLSKSLGKSMPENLGDIMNAQGLTGGIMNRVSSGRTPEDIMYAKWLAFSNPAGVMTKEIGYKNGGLVPGYDKGGLATSPYGPYVPIAPSPRLNNPGGMPQLSMPVGSTATIFPTPINKFDSRPKYGKRSDGLNAYQRFMIGQPDDYDFIDKFFGIPSIRKVLAGKGGGWDFLTTALAPLSGVASPVKAGAANISRKATSLISETQKTAAKAPSLLGAAGRALKAIPGAGKDLLKTGIWNTLGKIKPLNNLLYQMAGFKPVGQIADFKSAYKYVTTTGKSYFEEIINKATHPPRPGTPGAPPPRPGQTVREDDHWLNFVPQLKPMQAFADFAGLMKTKIINPISSNVISPIKNAYGMSKDKIMQAKSLFSKEGIQSIKGGISNFLYRYTPVGSIQALKKAKDMKMSLTTPEGGGTNLPLAELLEQITYHGGKLPEELLNRLTPGSTAQTGSIFNFDLFTTLDKVLARSYAVGKNSEAGGSLWEILWNIPKSMSKIWDMRGGAKSLWSQNKKAYAQLEKYFIDVLKMPTEEARAMLAGERVPGIARLADSLQDRVQLFSQENLNEAFSVVTKNGPEWLIDTIAHTGGVLMGQVPHSVLTTLDPQKMIKSMSNILPKEHLLQTLGAAPELMESTLERLMQQYLKTGRTFPTLLEGVWPAHKPKSNIIMANGGLIKGPGTGRSDSIRASLGYAGGESIRVSNGEYVVKASSVRDYGVKTMDAINNGTATIGANSGGTVYNINMPVTSNNANPEIVANEVMRKLKLEVSKNNKSNKVGL